MEQNASRLKTINKKPPKVLIRQNTTTS